MNIKFLLMGFISFVILVFILFNLSQSQPKQKWGRVCYEKTCFNVQLAQSNAERAKGLMFRKYLAQDEGMLFLFDKEDKYSFWMRNTLIPLDIIWMDKDNKVIFISENNQPCKWYYCLSVNPTANAKYVLEVNSGIVSYLGLKITDKLDLMY